MILRGLVFWTTCSVLAVAAPVSAQFGGLKSLKKAMDTVAKELEKPKTQPVAAPQGGYASPAPAPQPRQRPVVTTLPITQPQNTPSIAAGPSLPVNAQIVSAEVWNCFNEVSSEPIVFELNYTSTQKKNERGSFREISPFDDEGNEAPTPTVSSGSFRYEQTQTWNFLKLEYADQSKEYRSFTSSVGDDGVRSGEMDNLQCDLVSAKTTQNTQQNVAASLENSDNATKMQVAMAELQKRGAVTYFVPADESASGLPETTKPLAFFDTDFGPILLTGTETEDGGRSAASEFRVHRLKYDRDNRFSYVKTDGDLFHYGNEGRIPEYTIGYDYTDDLTLNFENNGGGSGCYMGSQIFIAIRQDGTIKSEFPISSTYNFNNRTVQFSGTINSYVKGESLNIEVVHKDYVERAGKTIFSKNRNFTQQYFYNEGVWSLAAGASQIEGC